MLKKIRIQYIIASVVAVIVLLCGIVTTTAKKAKINKVVANSYNVICNVLGNGNAKVTQKIIITTPDDKKELRELSLKFDFSNEMSSIDLSTLTFDYYGSSDQSIQYTNNKKVYENDSIIFSSNLFEDHNRTIDNKKLKKTGGYDILYIGSTDKSKGLSRSIEISLSYYLNNVVQMYDDYSYLSLHFLGTSFSFKSYILQIHLPKITKNEETLTEKIYVNDELKKNYDSNASDKTLYRVTTGDDYKVRSFDANVGMILKSSRFSLTDATAKDNYINKNVGESIKKKAFLKQINYTIKHSNYGICIFIVLNIFIFILISMLTNYKIKKEINDKEFANKLNPFTLQLLKGTFNYKRRELLLHLIYNEKIIKPVLNKKIVSLSYLPNNNETLADYFSKSVGGFVYMKDLLLTLKYEQNDVEKLLEKDAFDKNQITDKSRNILPTIIYSILSLVTLFITLLCLQTPTKYILISLHFILSLVLALSLLRKGYVSKESTQEYYKYKALISKIKQKSHEDLSLSDIEKAIPYSLTFHCDGTLIRLVEKDKIKKLFAGSKVSKNSAIIEYLIRSKN